jgi:hypothetical protein
VAPVKPYVKTKKRSNCQITRKLLWQLLTIFGAYLPCCSACTIRRPTAHWVAVIKALILRPEAAHAFSKATISDYIEP